MTDITICYFKYNLFKSPILCDLIEQLDEDSESNIRFEKLFVGPLWYMSWYIFEIL